jgi:hypothetical protein
MAPDTTNAGSTRETVPGCRLMAPAVVNRPAVERDAPTGVHPVNAVVEDWGRLYGIVAGAELREIRRP